MCCAPENGQTWQIVVCRGVPEFNEPHGHANFLDSEVGDRLCSFGRLEGIDVAVDEADKDHRVHESQLLVCQVLGPVTDNGLDKRCCRVDGVGQLSSGFPCPDL